MRDANIVTLYKNKGERSNWNNYRGISLLSVVGKLFARAALKRLQVLAERIYPEPQCAQCVLPPKVVGEMQRTTATSFVAFIDLTKVFYLVSRDGLLWFFPRQDVHPGSSASLNSFMRTWRRHLAWRHLAFWVSRQHNWLELVCHRLGLILFILSLLYVGESQRISEANKTTNTTVPDSTTGWRFLPWKERRHQWTSPRATKKETSAYINRPFSSGVNKGIRQKKSPLIS